ncbi:hypothetical protein BW897_12685 [Bacillus cereus]|uniref:Uncharacterized protein n=2 Tax=Bacillus cereus group TaxID=86661 RepID=A0A9X5MZS2_BACTU|nr:MULTISPECIES: DUF5986 family protein [Bacillus cereus group]MEB9855897.1 DUF5986 family protein [Bacillus cereus]MEB9887293.1 DUF5986 family protein [Bacillus cereus]OFC88858.1 hypothetical protein BTGOE4_58840 [Bacillus thuringiensis]OOR12552.1 hypothetical protein BW897_12685 [Bacillus cereus]PFD49248.1 hypothetical protein CN293_19080 [Bacillus cereus]
MQSNSIPLSDKHKELIIQALVDALGQDVKEYKEEKQNYTGNGIPHIKWDFINTRLNNYLDNEEFLIRPIRRGFYEHIQVYHKETCLMFVLMREYRYEDLKKEIRNTLNPPHYVFAYAQANDGMSPSEIFPTQFEFELAGIENLLPVKIEEAKKQYDILASDLSVDKFVLVTFTEKAGVVKSVKAQIPSSVNLSELVPYEDWSEHIDVFYEEVRFENSYEEDEEDSNIVSLKEKIYEEENLTSLKEKQRDENEEEKGK